MDRMVFDPLSLARALESCKSTLRDDSEWFDPAARGPFSDANDLLTWIRLSRAQLQQVTGSDYKVADNPSSLNAFQTERGLAPLFRSDEFDEGAFGISTFLNRQVRWADEATPTVLLAPETDTEHAAFEIPAWSFELYTLGFEQ